MRRRVSLFLGVAFWIVGFSQAQVTLEWARKYDGPPNPFGIDAALAIALDSSGNVLITGGSEGPNLYRDITTVKYSPSGNQLWVSRFNEVQDADMIGYNIDVDRSGNVYVAGGSIIKYTGNGDTLWIKRVVGAGTDARYIDVDENGGICATGGGRVTDWATLKFYSGGIEQWRRYLNGPANENDRTYAQHLDKQGNVIVTGRLANNITGRTDYIVGTAKYTSAGDTVWLRYYHGPTYYDAGYGVTSDDTGNVYVTGESEDSSGLPELVLLKYSPTGETRWTTRYRRTGIGDVGNEIVVDKSGNIYVAGVTGSSNFMLVKFNGQGEAQWSRVYAQYPFALPLPKIAMDTAGNVYVCAQQVRGSWSDYRIVKYDSNGTELWHNDYPQTGTGSNEPYDIKLDRAGNIYITGKGANDYLTLKFRQEPVSVETRTSDVPLSFALYQNYPNPFNPTTHFRFQIGESGMVTLKVFDVVGREVTAVVNKEMQPGSYEIEFDAKNLSGGIYLYTLSSGQSIATKKFVLLK